MTTTQKTSDQLAQELKERTARRDEFSNKLAALRREIEATRTETGRTKARGKPTGALRNRKRDLEDEAEEFADSIPILEEEIDDLTRELEAAKGSEAAQGYDAAEAEAVAALKAVDDALRTFEDETLAPLLDRLRTAMAEANQAERIDRKTNQRPFQAGPTRLYYATWAEAPGLEGILQALYGHAHRDLARVTALNASKQQTITDW